jgi:hypothetical protein
MADTATPAWDDTVGGDLTLSPSRIESSLGAGGRLLDMALVDEGARLLKQHFGVEYLGVMGMAPRPDETGALDAELMGRKVVSSIRATSEVCGHR